MGTSGARSEILAGRKEVVDFIEASVVTHGRGGGGKGREDYSGFTGSVLLVVMGVEEV